MNAESNASFSWPLNLFGTNAPADAAAPLGGDPDSADNAEANDTALRLAVAETKIEALHAMVEELQRARDSWQAQAERLALAEMRERANRVIDTTTLTVHELREVVTAAVLGASAGSRMSVSIVSFGYKYGLPVGMDVVLDVRFIPNPFFVPELRPLTGNDPRVHEYVMAQPEAKRFIDEVGHLFDFLIPLYQREGKSYLTVGLGCTGGRHRSPVLARELMKRLESSGFSSTIRDNDIAR